MPGLRALFHEQPSRGPLLPGAYRAHLSARHVQEAALGGHFKTAHPWALQSRTLGLVMSVATWLFSWTALSCPGRNAGLMEPVALAAHLDEVAVMHKAVEKRRDGGSVAKKLRPVFKWPV